MTVAENITEDIPKGLISWYQFNSDDKVLFIGEAGCSIAELLKDMEREGRIGNVLICPFADSLSKAWMDKHIHFFNTVISITDLERVEAPSKILSCWSELLAPHGRLLLGMNNRFGIKYFCGDRDPYTGRNFDGIENYRRCAARKEDVLGGHMYDKASLKDCLQNAGFLTKKFYSVFPDLEHPTLIYAEDFTPNEELNVRLFPMYNSPDTIFMEEEYLYSDLIKNKLFHTMANSFLVECYIEPNAECSDVSHVTISMDRGRENALFTIIHKNKSVEKRAIYKEGRNRLQVLMDNAVDLKEHGINVVDAELVEDSYQMPFIESETAIAYLRRQAHTDKEKFLESMDNFYDIILKSSEHISRIVDGKEVVCLKKGYFDLVPLNCFVIDNVYFFYDQEFCVDNCPIGVLIVRLVDLVYHGDFSLEKVLSKNFFFERYGVASGLECFRKIASEFLRKLRKEDELRLYHERFRRDSETVNLNRQRINFSEAEYQRIFVDVFKNLNGRKLVLFGSGAFAKRFLAMYGKDYPVHAIVDNNISRQGQCIEGIEIKSPEFLKEIPKEDYKVLICIKNYLSVVKQLEGMGITDYGIFDSARSYPRAIQRFDFGEQDKVEKKKYRVGYVAGVFDMFHIGHVNLLRKAKDQCEYLIVGVVSDEDCFRQKEKYPIISCEDRVAVLRACKYVNQVEALPTGYGGIRNAYKMYRFDVMFSGDDHGDDQEWLANQEYLKKHGADIVFFNYTESTSSTKIRELLRKDK